jgi:hypothetical protein
MGDAMLLCVPDTRSGMYRDIFACLICISHLPGSSNWSLSLPLPLLFPPPACISLIAITCFNWPVNRICVYSVCAERGGCSIRRANPSRDKRLLSSPKYPHRLLGWPSPMFSGCRIFAPGYSGRVDHLTSAKLRVKNA